jgi:polar amino acid transport system substrate-binding protein
MAKDIAKSQQVGMTAHIGKPININEMFATIAAALPERTPIPTAVKIAGTNETQLNYANLVDINYQQGLARVQNNHRLYQKLLQKFTDHYSDFEQQFRTAQHSDDHQASERLAHSLKGVAANLGADKVKEAAQALEDACAAQDQALIDEQLAQTLLKLTPVLLAISTVITEQPELQAVDSQPSGPEGEQLAKIIAELEALLKDDDTAAGDKLSELGPLLTSAAVKQLCDGLTLAVDDFDFEQALNYLIQLKTKLGITN